MEDCGQSSNLPSFHDRWIALALVCFLLSVYLLTFSGRYHASDEISMLVATDSLARRGGWDTDLIRWMGQQQGSFGPDGHLYSRKGIGATLAALPLYWIALGSQRLGNVQTAMLANGLITALTGALVYLYLRRLRFGTGASLASALAFGLATMAWPYARYLFSEPLAGLGVLLCACGLLRYRDRGDYRSLLWAGAGLGLALLARLNNAIVAPFLAAVLIAYLNRRHGWRAGAWRRWILPLVVFGLPVVASLAISGWYNWLRFGNPLTTGYLPEERFSAPFFQGLYGLTLSPGKGLLWYNPILFASLLAWPAFIRRNRAEGWLAAGVLAANVLFYSPWYLWWGGHAWGPRFLVAALPFAALPLASALDAAARRRWLAAGLGALALVSVAVQGLGVAVNFNLYLDNIYAKLGLYHPATLFNPAYSPLLRQAAYLRLPNLDLAWARGGTVDAIALACSLALVAFTGLVLALVARRDTPISLRLFPAEDPDKNRALTGSRNPVGAGGNWCQGLTIGAAAAVLLLPFLVLLPRYAPSGDLAHAAGLLAQMERPGQLVALADSSLTEPFQDAYDGHLPLWSGPVEPGQPGEPGVWTVGGSTSRPASAHFQVGNILMELQLTAGNYVDLGRVGGITHPSAGSELGNRLELAGWGAPSTAQQGNRLPIVLAWRALAPVDTSYTVFVQAIDSRGVKAGQVDRLPCEGACPTTVWRPGDVVAEWLELPIRADAPPGEYQLIAGLYDLSTGQRVPVAGAGDYVLLGALSLRP